MLLLKRGVGYGYPVCIRVFDGGGGSSYAPLAVRLMVLRDCLVRKWFALW